MSVNTSSSKRTKAKQAAPTEEGQLATVDLTFSPPLDRTATTSSLRTDEFMRSPSVLQKLTSATSAGKGKSQPSSSSVAAAAAMPARTATTSVVRPLSTRANQATSHFLTSESDSGSLGAEDGQDGPTIGTSTQAVLSGSSLTAPLETSAADTQTERVVYFPVTLIPDKEQRLQSMGLDMIRLLRMYSHAHPEALDTRGQLPPRPSYPFEDDPALIETPKTDRHWPEPPLPLDVDWVDDSKAIKDYREQVMIFHLVAAAQSLIRAHFPGMYDKSRQRVVKMRDISIGYKDAADKNQRLVVSCHEQPGTIISAQEYDPKWDIASDDGITDEYEGNTTAEREHNCLSELLQREKARRDAFRTQVLRLRTIHTHPTDATPGEAHLADIVMTGKEVSQYASWEGLAHSVWEYHQILANVIPAVKTDKAALQLHQELLAEERAARSAEATLRRDQGLELERLKSVATAAQARETELDGLLQELREELKHHSREGVRVREAYKSDLMRAQAREDGLALQLGALQSQFDDLQAELTRLQSAPHGEVGRGLPGYTPSSVGDESYQTPYTGKRPDLTRSDIPNSGESSHVDPGSAETGSTVVRFLHQNPEISFLGEVSAGPESSTTSLQQPHPRTTRGDSASKAQGGVGDMGPPQPRTKVGMGSAHEAYSTSKTDPDGSAATPASNPGLGDSDSGSARAHSTPYYGPAGSSAVKPDPPGLASPGGGATVERVDASKLVPESMKKKSLKSLEEEPLKVFREVFRYHLKAGDPCTDWHMWVPDEFHATIRRRLQSLLDPTTHAPKYTTELAENWRKMDVGVCLDDLINAKSIPNVVGLPMATALGGMGFADRLLEPTYYETVEAMLTKLYKKYGSEYEQERKTKSLPLVKALDKSFKAQTSGRTVSQLIRAEDPTTRGYLPESVAEYVDAAARHAVNKTKLDQSKRLYEEQTWDGAKKKDSSASKPLCPGCGSRTHEFSACTFTKSEWYNANEDVAFVDSKLGKAYKKAKGKTWIQNKDKESKKRPQRDYESDHRGDVSRRRVSSQSRDTAHDDTSDWERKGPRDRRTDYPNSDGRHRGVSFDRDRSRSPSQSKRPSGDSGRNSREPSAESIRDSRSGDRHDSASKDKGKSSGSSSKPSEAARDTRGSSSRDDRRGSSSRDDRRGSSSRDDRSNDRRSSSPHASRDKKRSCECIDTADEYVLVCEYLSTLANSSDVLRKEDQLLAASLPHPANPSDPHLPRLFVDVLPDTGAWSANYINEATAAWLRSVGVKREECKTSVCSGIGTSQQFCVPCGGTYTFLITIYNDLLEGDETLSITANEIPSVYAVLLGRKTIKQHNISLKCFRFFSNLETGESLAGFVSYNLYATVHKPQLCSSSLAATAAAKPQATIVVQGGDATKYAGTRPKSDFLSPEPDEDFIDPGDDYRMPWEEDPDGGVDVDRPESVRKDTDSFAASIGLEVTGSARFIDLVDALLEEYSVVLNTIELGVEPADLPPLDVAIDVNKWHCPKSQGHARNQSVDEGQQEIRRHLEPLLDCGAITPVLHAPAYSQVLLVEKPDTDEKRLVLVYRRVLSECVGHAQHCSYD